MTMMMAGAAPERTPMGRESTRHGKGGRVQTMKILCFFLALLLLQLPSAANSNPIAKFLMMNGEKNRRDTAPGNEDAPAAFDDSNVADGTTGQCVDSSRLQKLVQQLQETEKARVALQTERDALENRLQTKSDALNALQKETDERLAVIQQTSDATQQIAAAQDQFAKRLASLQNQSQADLEQARNTVARLEQELVDKKHEYDEKSVLQRQLADKRVEESKTECAKGLSSIETTSRMHLATIDAECRSTMEALTKQLEEKIASADAKAVLSEGQLSTLRGEKDALQALFDSTLQEFDGKLDASQASAKAEHKSLLEAEWQDKMAAANDERQKLLEDCEQSSRQAVAATAELQSQLDAADDASRKAVADLQRELDGKHHEALNKLRSEYESKMEALQQSAAVNEKAVKDASENSRRLEQATAGAKLQLQNAQRDARYWQDAFEQRSLFNATYIFGETTSSLHRVGDSIENQMTLGWHWVEHKFVLAAQHVLDQWAWLQTFTAKVSAFYRTHVKPQVDTTIKVTRQLTQQAWATLRPHFQQHVEPWWRKTQAAVTAFVDKSRALVLRHRDQLVDSYAKFCSQVLQELQQVKRMSKVIIPQSVVDGVQQSCNRPRESVYGMIELTAFILAIVLRRMLFRAVWTCIRLLLRIAMMPVWLALSILLFPFRLVVGRRSKKKVEQPPKKTTKGRRSNGAYPNNSVLQR